MSAANHLGWLHQAAGRTTGADHMARSQSKFGGGPKPKRWARPAYGEGMEEADTNMSEVRTTTRGQAPQLGVHVGELRVCLRVFACVPRVCRVCAVCVCCLCVFCVGGIAAGGWGEDSCGSAGSWNGRGVADTCSLCLTRVHCVFAWQADDNLDKMGVLIGGLNSMATDMGSALASQNEKIKTAQDKTGRNVEKQEKVMSKLDKIVNKPKKDKDGGVMDGASKAKLKFGMKAVGLK